MVTKRLHIRWGGAAAHRADPAAITSPAAVLVFVFVVAAGITGDLLTKHVVFRSMLSDPHLLSRAEQLGRANPADLDSKDVLSLFSQQVCPGVRFTLSTNPGIVFGLPMPRWAVAIASVVTIGLVVGLFLASERRCWAIHVALGLICAGAGGNLYDRLFAKVVVAGFEPIRYQVRDFIDCSQLHYNYIFNVADALLVIGVGVLILHWIFAGRRQASCGS